MSVLKLIQKDKGILAGSFYEASLTVIPKLDKDITRKEDGGTTFFSIFNNLLQIIAAGGGERLV